MDLTLRRALVGYRRSQTLALFQTLEQESVAAQAARDAELRELSRQLDAALASLRETEALIAAEQERQQVALALLDEFASRGAQAVSAAKATMDAAEAAVVGMVARREMALAQRRQLLHELHDDVEAAIRKAMQAIESTADGEGASVLAGHAVSGPLLALDETQERERAGA